MGRLELLSIGDFVDFVDLALIGSPEKTIDVGSETARWYLATTNPNCEARAVLGLYAAGFRTFVPKVRRWVSHARVKKAVERPLLGRYVFVEIDFPKQSFHAVRAVNGVECLLSNPDPLPVPQHYIDNLRRRYMAGEWDEVAQGSLPLGARIRIVEGQFDNMLATITNVTGRKVVAKLLDSTTYVKLHECSVRAA